MHLQYVFLGFTTIAYDQTVGNAIEWWLAIAVNKHIQKDYKSSWKYYPHSYYCKRTGGIPTDETQEP